MKNRKSCYYFLTPNFIKFVLFIYFTSIMYVCMYVKILAIQNISHCMNTYVWHMFFTQT